MDVHCRTCGEPWDVDHLRHEIIHDTGLSTDQIEKWKALSSAEKLEPLYKMEFQSAGWEFGTGLTSVHRCPCCKVNGKPADTKEAAV